MNKQEIIRQIVEEYAVNRYENGESCEACPLNEEVCQVAQYDGYELYPTDGAWCAEEILKAIGIDKKTE